MREREREDGPLVLLDGFSDEFGTPRFTLRLDNDALLLLQRLIDEVRGPLRRLLRNLLRLDRLAESRREGDVRDRDVVEDEVEAAGAAFEVVADELGDHLALGDELTMGLLLVVWSVRFVIVLSLESDPVVCRERTAGTHEALNWATTLLRTSLTMLGRTTSS